MPYEIVVREGETPGEGQILTQQSGTFGEDGTAKWGGYRTVDLNNFVFLAKDKKYTVEVKTTQVRQEKLFVLRSWLVKTQKWTAKVIITTKYFKLGLRLTK